MRKIFYSLAALMTIFTMSSCENDGVNNGGDSTVTVVATLENGRHWNIGDEVIINGGKYTVNEGETSTAVINDVDAADKYCAAYDIGNGSVVGSTLNFEVDAIQGPALSMAKPMVASNTKPNLVFKNLLGTLSLSVSGSGTITRVIVSSTDTPIAGNGSVEMDFSGSPIVTMGSDGSRSITVDLGEGVTLPADVDLNLPDIFFAVRNHHLFKKVHTLCCYPQFRFDQIVLLPDNLPFRTDRDNIFNSFHCVVKPGLIMIKIRSGTFKINPLKDWNVDSGDILYSGNNFPDLQNFTDPFRNGVSTEQNKPSG